MRNFLLVALGLVCLLLWQAWQKDYVYNSPHGEVAARKQAIIAKNSSDVPVEIADFVPGEKYLSDKPEHAVNERTNSQIIEVRTDLFDIKIDTKGGSVVALDLVEFPHSSEAMEKFYTLLSPDEEQLYQIEGGLLSKQRADRVDHTVVYSSNKSSFVMSEDKKTLEVVLLWENRQGKSVEKIFRFKRGSYLFSVDYRIKNQGDSTWTLREYSQIKKRQQSSEGFLRSYNGPVFWSSEAGFSKVSFGDIDDKSIEKSAINSWIAMQQHYFLGALLSNDAEEKQQYYFKRMQESKRKEEGLYLIGAVAPEVLVEPNTEKVISRNIYIGPKKQTVFSEPAIEQIAPKLSLTLDYGPLWFIARPLFNCLNWFHGILGSWGWSIVALTCLIKLLLYKLSAAGYRSMAKMRDIHPKMKALQERFKDDKPALQQAMLGLYREQKINPLGAFFPFLLQIPVFLALYWMLIETVDIRMAPFLTWIVDLSEPDPFYILPALMGGSMFLQQKLNPTPMEPLHKKIMTAMLVGFSIFFAFFPAGLVLYWVTNNFLSIPQQWFITRKTSSTSKN